MSSTRQQIFSTCFIVSDQFCLITQTSSGSFSYIVTGVKGTYFIHHLQSTNHVSAQVWTAKNTYRLSAGCDKTPAWLWEYCRFILGLTSIYLKKIIWNERPDNATFSVAKSITFPIFGNADTQSADHRKPIFTHMWKLCNFWVTENAVYSSQIPSLGKNALVPGSLNWHW